MRTERIDSMPFADRPENELGCRTQIAIPRTGTKPLPHARFQFRITLILTQHGRTHASGFVLFLRYGVLDPPELIVHSYTR